MNGPRLVLALAIGFVGGCDSTPTGPASGSGPETAWQTRDWPTARGGGGLQGRVADPVPRDPELAWTFEAGAGVIAEPVIADGVVYVGSVAGDFHALDLATGEARWSLEFDDSVEGAACVVGDLVLVGTNDGLFRALQAADGSELWRIEGQDKFSSGANPLAGGDEPRVLVNGYDGIARCLRLADGSLVWEYATGNYINGTPAIVDGRLTVFGGCDAILHTIDLASGEVVGEVTTEAYITNSVATEGRRMFCGNYANQVVAAEVGRDEPLWVYSDRDFPFFSAPALGHGAVFIGSRDKHLHAIDQETGEMLAPPLREYPSHQIAPQIATQTHNQRCAQKSAQ